MAAGIELVGEYEGSGYVEPHFLARRSTGSLVQLTRLLYLVGQACDGNRHLDRIAEQVSAEFGRTVTADNVKQLIDAKLMPLGLLADSDGNSPEVEPLDPLLSLKLKTTLLGGSGVRSAAAVMRPLFWPPVIAAVLVVLIAFDIWLFFVHGIAQSLRSTVEQPLVFLLIAALVVVSTALHELGHAAGAVYGGAKPGRMGAGVFLVWPAFYTDVTDVYRLDRRGRLRTDLGGVYLNAIVVLACAGAFLLTGYPPLLLLCFLVQMQIIQQLLPLLRLDGYYVLSDAVGVPDLFKRVGPILRSLVPWKPTDPAVLELRRRVRFVVTAWIFVIVPLLLVNIIFLLLNAPRMVATAWDTAARLWGVVIVESGAAVAAAAIQLVFLAIPVVGFGLTIVRLGRFLAGKARDWARGSTPRTAVLVTAAAAVVAVLAVAWWPDQRFAPYRPGESATVPSSVGDLRYVGQGAPLLRSPSEAQTPLEAVPDGSSGVAADVSAVSEGEGPPSGGVPPLTEGTPGTTGTPVPTSGDAPPTTSGDSSSTTSASSGPGASDSPDSDADSTGTSSPSATSESPSATPTPSR